MDDDEVSLSSHALAALAEFKAEQQEAIEKFNRLQEKAETDFALVSMDSFQEDWQLSQFWYNEETASALAQECLKHTKQGDQIAFISAPTAYVSCKKLAPERTLKLFEYDRRFNVFGSDFCFYDFNNPTEIPKELKNSFDFIIADPPFLSRECFEKASISIKFLLKHGGKLLVLTGQVQKQTVEELVGTKQTLFEPKHKNGLSNEFGCFANYSSSSPEFAFKINREE